MVVIEGEGEESLLLRTTFSGLELPLPWKENLFHLNFVISHSFSSVATERFLYKRLSRFCNMISCYCNMIVCCVDGLGKMERRRFSNRDTSSFRFCIHFGKW